MTNVLHPKVAPTIAAQQVVLALIESKSFGRQQEHAIENAEDAEKVAKAIIHMHEQLTAYYRGLHADQ